MTAMGEATSDYTNAALGPAITVPIMLIGLCLALKVQFKRDHYVGWGCWLASFEGMLSIQSIYAPA
jgi:uncharacterized membrane-anchored protein